MWAHLGGPGQQTEVSPLPGSEPRGFLAPGRVHLSPPHFKAPSSGWSVTCSTVPPRRPGNSGKARRFQPPLHPPTQSSTVAVKICPTGKGQHPAACAHRGSRSRLKKVSPSHQEKIMGCFFTHVRAALSGYHHARTGRKGHLAPKLPSHKRREPGGAGPSSH